MKKSFCVFSFIFVFLLIFLNSFSNSECSKEFEKKEIVLQINNPVMKQNGKDVPIDSSGTMPVIKNGHTLVPIRSIIEHLGGSVTWNEAEKSINLSYNNNEVKLTVNMFTAYLNGKECLLDVCPVIISEKTMLPIRFIAESFGFNVLWNGNDSKITIQSPSDDDKIENNDNKLTIRFFDVGQGDCEFLEFPDGKTMLIDAGMGADEAYNYIKNLGYTSIDCVIASHPDSDHIGGMKKIIDNFKIDTFYMPNKTHTSKTFEKMLISLKQNGCKTVYAFDGNSALSGENYTAQFVAPCNTYSDNNNSSAVVRVLYNNCSFLFTGDIENEAENDILSSGHDISADIIKVAHHGSSTSSSEKFIKKVNPKYAVISVGADNKYGHPALQTLNNLSKKGIIVYRTDFCGTITVTSDGNTYSFCTEKAVAE